MSAPGADGRQREADGQGPGQVGPGQGGPFSRGFEAVKWTATAAVPDAIRQRGDPRRTCTAPSGRLRPSLLFGGVLAPTETQRELTRCSRLSEDGRKAPSGHVCFVSRGEFAGGEFRIEMLWDNASLLSPRISNLPTEVLPRLTMVTALWRTSRGRPFHVCEISGVFSPGLGEAGA